MLDVSLQLRGVKEVLDTIGKDLPPKAQAKVIAQTLRQAAAPLRKEMKARARKRSGALAMAMSNWRVTKGLRRSSVKGIQAAARVHVGPRRGNKRAQQIYFNHYYGGRVSPSRYTEGIRHGHLVEWGHASPSGGKVQGHPFAGPAIASKGQAVVAEFEKRFRRNFEKEIVRLRRKKGFAR